MWRKGKAGSAVVSSFPLFGNAVADTALVFEDVNVIPIEAKAHFSEVVAASRREPQILLSRNKPVGALVGMKDFQRFQDSVRETDAPSVSSLLDEIQEISKEEEELEQPRRTSRPVPDLGQES